MPLHLKPPVSRSDSREVGWVREHVRRRGARGEGWGAPSGHGPGQGAARAGWAAASCPRRQAGAEGRPSYLPLTRRGASAEPRISFQKPPCASRLRPPARTAHKPQPLAPGLSGVAC